MTAARIRCGSSRGRSACSGSNVERSKMCRPGFSSGLPPSRCHRTSAARTRPRSRRRAPTSPSAGVAPIRLIRCGTVVGIGAAPIGSELGVEAGVDIRGVVSLGPGPAQRLPQGFDLDGADTGREDLHILTSTWATPRLSGYGLPPQLQRPILWSGGRRPRPSSPAVGVRSVDAEHPQR